MLVPTPTAAVRRQTGTASMSSTTTLETTHSRNRSPSESHGLQNAVVASPVAKNVINTAPVLSVASNEPVFSAEEGVCSPTARRIESGTGDSSRRISNDYEFPIANMPGSPYDNFTVENQSQSWFASPPDPTLHRLHHASGDPWPVHLHKVELPRRSINF
jgi:hypothetical protein